MGCAQRYINNAGSNSRIKKKRELSFSLSFYEIFDLLQYFYSLSIYFDFVIYFYIFLSGIMQFLNTVINNWRYSLYGRKRPTTMLFSAQRQSKCMYLSMYLSLWSIFLSFYPSRYMYVYDYPSIYLSIYL